MDTLEHIEFLCLSCGLQGMRTEGCEAGAGADDSCPKCGERLLTMTRPQPDVISATV